MVFGTRPEAIKMAPLFLALKKEECFDVKLCVTGQHREMLDQVLEVFEIVPDYDLNIMKADQTLNEITARILSKLDPILESINPDLLLVHGDTTTTFSASLAAFHKKIKIGHIEAGLRTGDLNSPWPEEANRKMTAVIADMHFAPTVNSKQNLIDEHVAEDAIFVTGNTVIDALFFMHNKIRSEPKVFEGLFKNFPKIKWHEKIILMTGHRRENFGKNFENICVALKRVAEKFPNCQIIFPVHLNPSIRNRVDHILQNIPNIHLISPLNYQNFICLMDKSYIILTDSGGIQEEAPSLGKPVLVTRTHTERPEAVEAGTVIMVGSNVETITGYISQLLIDNIFYDNMSMKHNPYGDGHASKKIITYLKNEL